MRFAGVTQDDAGVHVTLEDGEALEADLLLVAVGRGPNANGLGYEEVGVAMDRGFVLTDDRLRTNVPGVYAVGDIVPGLQLAHRGFQQGIFVAEEIAGLNPARHRRGRHPAGHLLRARGRLRRPHRGAGTREVRRGNVEAYEYNLGGNGKSQILGTAGFIKLVREKDGPVVGVHMVGARVGELIGEGQLDRQLGGLPRGRRHPRPRPPDPERGPAARRILALAGKPLHAHA